MQVRGVTTTICDHVKKLKPYFEYTNQNVPGAMSNELKAVYSVLSAESKTGIPSRDLKVTYAPQVSMLDRVCTQSLENTQLLDDILGEQPITI